VRILEADSAARAGFHEHFVARSYEFEHAGRHHADTVFMDLDFFRYADFHVGCAPR